MRSPGPGPPHDTPRSSVKYNWPDGSITVSCQAADDSQVRMTVTDTGPGLSADEILQQLASTGVTAQIPVVILSGDSGQSTVQQLLARGAAGFLAKPFTVPEFIATLDRFLAPPAG